MGVLGYLMGVLGYLMGVPSYWAFPWPGGGARPGQVALGAKKVALGPGPPGPGPAPVQVRATFFVPSATWPHGLAPPPPPGHGNAQ